MCWRVFRPLSVLIHWVNRFIVSFSEAYTTRTHIHTYEVAPVAFSVYMSVAVFLLNFDAVSSNGKLKTKTHF